MATKFLGETLEDFHQHFHQEVLCFIMKLVDFAFSSHFSSAFCHEISPGNFPFFLEYLNFTLRHFLHETGNVFCLYKHCSFANKAMGQCYIQIVDNKNMVCNGNILYVN